MASNYDTSPFSPHHWYHDHHPTSKITAPIGSFKNDPVRGHKLLSWYGLGNFCWYNNFYGRGLFAPELFDLLLLFLLLISLLFYIFFLAETCLQRNRRTCLTTCRSLSASPYKLINTISIVIYNTYCKITKYQYFHHHHLLLVYKMININVIIEPATICDSAQTEWPDQESP